MLLVLIKSTGIWLMMVIAAILNGLFREQVLNPIYGIEISLSLSGVSLSVMILIISYFLIPVIGKKPAKVFIVTGLFWLALTLSFEYLFGYFVIGKALAEINDVFNLSEGNLFIVVLMITAVAPWLAAKLRDRIL